MSDVTIYLEKSKDLLCSVFTGFKDNERLCWYASVGVPKAIAFYLQKKMFEEQSEKVSLDIPGETGTLCTFSLAVNKRGDSVGFAPSFELGEEGLKILCKDKVSDAFDADYYEAMGLRIGKNTDFVDAIVHAFKCDVCTDAVWEESGESSNMETAKGIAFERNSAANGFSDYTVATAICICAIFAVLGKYKDPVKIAECDVDSLGTFKLTPTKNGYDLALVFDKEFKANTKCDRIAEKMADLD